MNSTLAWANKWQNFESLLIILLAAHAGPHLCLGAGNGTTVSTVDSPPTSSVNPFYTANRQPLTPSPLIKLPIGSIKPEGWLGHQLELEAEGLTGRLPEITKWCKFESNAWADSKGQGQNGWEELPYWLKGYGDLAACSVTKTSSRMRASGSTRFWPARTQAAG